MNDLEKFPSKPILDRLISEIRSNNNNPHSLLSTFKKVLDFVFENVAEYEREPLFYKMRLCIEKTEKVLSLSRKSLIKERLHDIAQDAVIYIEAFSRTGGAQVKPR